MEIIGIVTSGQGKGAYFMSQPFYKNQFKDKLKFIPYEGTLNIRIGDKEIDDIQNVSPDNIMKIEGGENFGDVSLLKATLNDNIDGAIVFPKQTTHGENILEFIASENIKKELGIKNGDSVKITLID